MAAPKNLAFAGRHGFQPLRHAHHHGFQVLEVAPVDVGQLHSLEKLLAQAPSVVIGMQ